MTFIEYDSTKVTCFISYGEMGGVNTKVTFIAIYRWEGIVWGMLRL